MKASITTATVVGLLLIAGGSRTLAQGTFRNMFFESAVPPLEPGSYVMVSNALPGWSAFLDGAQVGWVSYNNYSIGGPMITLLGPGSLYPVLQGQYSVFLQPHSTEVAIAQTGMIPSTALSLKYVAIDQPDVYFSGQALTSVLLGAGPNGSSLYGVDISQFAGLTGELRFGSRTGGAIFDSIRFSTNAVPEPGSLALVGVASVLLVLSLRRRGK